MCTKPAYTSYRAAEIEARRIVRDLKRHSGKTIKKLEPYPCPDCGHMHLTTHSRTRLKKVG